jgi:hypothetical protein
MFIVGGFVWQDWLLDEAKLFVGVNSCRQETVKIKDFDRDYALGWACL